MIKLDVDTWTKRAKTHEELVAPLAEAFISRRARRVDHPVHDFLFTYYTCSPQKLKQWVPPFDEELCMTDALQMDYPWLSEYWFHYESGTLSLNRERIPANSLGLAAFVQSLCANILRRPPRFGCFGLHEWAMVYRAEQAAIKHTKLPLRLKSDEIAAFVESQTICCSHYDAYRFFTPAARPLNTLNPQLETRLKMEQGGCLHANMDLYKWATKLWPWIGSDFIGKAFILAAEIRELDMRASPYDLRTLGFTPICIETEEGRLVYLQQQQLFAARAVLLREKLQAFCEKLMLSTNSA